MLNYRMWEGTRLDNVNTAYDLTEAVSMSQPTIWSKPEKSNFIPLSLPKSSSLSHHSWWTQNVLCLPAWGTSILLSHSTWRELTQSTTRAEAWCLFTQKLHEASQALGASFFCLLLTQVFASVGESTSPVKSWTGRLPTSPKTVF